MSRAVSGLGPGHSGITSRGCGFPLLDLGSLLLPSNTTWAGPGFLPNQATVWGRGGWECRKGMSLSSSAVCCHAALKGHCIRGPCSPVSVSVWVGVPLPALFRSLSEVCLWQSRQGQPGCYGRLMGRPGSQCPAPAHFIIQSVLQGFQQLPESLASVL